MADLGMTTVKLALKIVLTALLAAWIMEVAWFLIAYRAEGKTEKREGRTPARNKKGGL